MVTWIYNVWHVIMGSALILGCYFIGVWLSQWAALPLPGALIGLLLLLAVLFVFPALEPLITFVARPFLLHMSVLFVPAVLSVSLYWDDIQQHAIAITIAIVITTCISLGLTAIFSSKIFASHTKLKMKQSGILPSLNESSPVKPSDHNQ